MGGHQVRFPAVDVVNMSGLTDSDQPRRPRGGLGSLPDAVPCPATPCEVSRARNY